MSSVTISKHTTQSACAGQTSHIYRVHKNYGNEQIDLSQSERNICLGCHSSSEAIAKIHRRIEEVDTVLPPKRVKQDRKTVVEYCLPAPREGMPIEEQVRFLKTAYAGLKALYGEDNIICGVIHLDEINEYKRNGEKHISRAHLHVLGVPFVPDKGINCKNFLTRETFKKTNELMDEICKRMYGYTYQDGTKTHIGRPDELKHKKDLEEQNEVLRNELDTLKGQYEKLDAVNEELYQRAQEKSLVLNRTREQLKALETRLNALQRHLNTLEDQKSALELQNAELTLQKADIQREHEELLAKIKHNLKSLKSQNTSLQGQNLNLRKSNIDLQGEASALLRQIKGFRSNLELVKSETGEAQEKRNAVMKEYGELQDKHDNLKAEYKTLSAKVSRKTEELKKVHGVLDKFWDVVCEVFELEHPSLQELIRIMEKLDLELDDMER